MELRNTRTTANITQPQNAPAGLVETRGFMAKSTPLETAIPSRSDHSLSLASPATSLNLSDIIDNLAPDSSHAAFMAMAVTNSDPLPIEQTMGKTTDMMSFMQALLEDDAEVPDYQPNSAASSPLKDAATQTQSPTQLIESATQTQPPTQLIESATQTQPPTQLIESATQTQTQTFKQIPHNSTDTCGDQLQPSSKRTKLFDQTSQLLSRQSLMSTRVKTAAALAAPDPPATDATSDHDEINKAQSMARVQDLKGLSADLWVGTEQTLQILHMLLDKDLKSSREIVALKGQNTRLREQVSQQLAHANTLQKEKNIDIMHSTTQLNALKKQNDQLKNQLFRASQPPMTPAPNPSETIETPRTTDTDIASSHQHMTRANARPTP